MSNQRSILVADDDPALRETIVGILESEGYAVTAVSDGAEALDLIEREPPDLFITDIIMPEKEGLETIRELRANGSDVKIIAMSGSGLSQGDFLKFSRSFGADRTLAKPFTPAQLLEAAAEMLA